MSTVVKICGLMRAQDVAAVNRCGPEYAGFVFAPGRRRLLPQAAKELIALLDSSIVPVGVFADEAVEKVADIARFCALGAVQLHGNEDNGYIMALRRLLPERTPVIKAVRVRDARSLLSAEGVDCDLLLLDAYVEGQAGGAGRAFDWALLEDFKKPYLLAGGLARENVAGAVALLRPFGVDVSSGVETSGAKDPEKIRKFIEMARGGAG